MNRDVYSPERYVYAQKVLNELHLYRRLLTTDEYNAIRRKALNGDIDGAFRDMASIKWERLYNENKRRDH